MSGFLRKVAHATSSNKPESTEETRAIEEELSKINEVEAILKRLTDQVQRKIVAGQADLEAETQLWKSVKSLSADWGKSDFLIEKFLSKAAQVGLVVSNQKQKMNESGRGSLILPFSKWIRDEVKEAEDSSKVFKALHSQYSKSINEVKRINSKPDPPLSVLQKAEQERDALKFSYERESKLTLQNLTHIYDNGKLDTMRHLCDYMQDYLDFFRTSAAAIEKLQEDIRECRQYIERKERGQEQESKALQDNITRTEQERQASRKRAGRLEPPRPVDESILSEAVTIKNFPLTVMYDVRRDRTRSQLSLNIKTRQISISSESGERLNAPVDDILTLIKASKNSEGTKLKFLWSGTKESKLESFVFNSQMDREQFYESFMFAKKGSLRYLTTNHRAISVEDLKVFCGTWNMGDAAPPYEVNLNAWLPKDEFDIYVVAVQESDFVPRPGFVSPEEDLFGWLGSHLGENYIKLTHVSLLSIRLVCYVKREHYYKISRVRTATVATGLANVIGNKGGSAIAFDFYDVPFCFIGSHLAARIDRKRLEVRNQNYRDILKGLSSFSRNGLGDIHHEFDYLFWLGDLNYRIELSRDDIINKIYAQDYSFMRKHDQLLNERAEGNCFLDFEEAEPNFSPTYRFNRGDRTFSEEKMREPAWCDRVMWKSIPRGTISQLDYGASHALMTSDHSPVYSTFLIHVDLPAIPHVRDTNCRIVVTDLRGHDLKPTKGQWADPFIIFQAPWMSSYVQTPVCEKTTNPTWEGQDFVIFPGVTNKDFLNKRYIRIVVKDNNRNDMGQGIIYLESAIGKPMKFTTRIVDKARVFGHVQGTIQVLFGKDYEDPIEFDPVSAIVRGSAEVDQYVSSSPVATRVLYPPPLPSGEAGIPLNKPIIPQIPVMNTAPGSREAIIHVTGSANIEEEPQDVSRTPMPQAHHQQASPPQQLHQPQQQAPLPQHNPQPQPQPISVPQPHHPVTQQSPPPHHNAASMYSPGVPIPQQSSFPVPPGYQQTSNTMPQPSPTSPGSASVSGSSPPGTGYTEEARQRPGAGGGWSGARVRPSAMTPTNLRDPNSARAFSTLPAAQLSSSAPTNQSPLAAVASNSSSLASSAQLPRSPSPNHSLASSSDSERSVSPVRPQEAAAQPLMQHHRQGQHTSSLPPPVQIVVPTTVTSLSNSMTENFPDPSVRQVGGGSPDGQTPGFSVSTTAPLIYSKPVAPKSTDTEDVMAQLDNLLGEFK